MIKHRNTSISRNFNIDTMLFIDEQILPAKFEDEPQYSIHNFNNRAAELSMDKMLKK
jgi:hypothetical protein